MSFFLIRATAGVAVAAARTSRAQGRTGLLVLLVLITLSPETSAQSVRHDPFVNAMIRHSQALEKRILREGRPLTAEELAIAQAAEIRRPERIRILVLPAVPEPQDAFLRARLHAMGMLQVIRLARGTAKGYGIIVTTPASRRKTVIAHELVHVRQFERMGGIAALLRRHLPDLLESGYRKSELESEAYRLAPRLVAGLAPRT